MEGQKALGIHQKYLNLCSKDEQRTYGFGTTWGWVINDNFSIFGWTILLRIDLFLSNTQFAACYETLIDGLGSCGLLWCFLSAVWTLILTAPIHCRGSISRQVILNFSKSVPMKKQYHLHLGCSKVNLYHIFCVNYYFKTVLNCPPPRTLQILYISLIWHTHFSPEVSSNELMS